METEEVKAHKTVLEKMKQAYPADKSLWAIYIALCIFSIVEHYSASSSIVSSTDIIGPLVKQCIHLGLGFVVLYVVQKIPYQYFIPLVPVLAVGAIVLALLVLFAGKELNGATRSIDLGVMDLQSAEFVKIAAVSTLALILSRTQLKNQKGISKAGVWGCVGVVLVGSGLLITQGITNTILLVAICISMLIIGGMQVKKILLMCVVFAVLGGGLVGVKLLIGNTKNKEKTESVDRFWDVAVKRLDRYFDPTEKWEREINKTNRQEQYSYIAQANGGIFGVFPGNSRESARLSLAFSDYIYAIIIEDLGLVGGVIVLILYLSILFRAMGIATQCVRAFPMLLVIGMGLYITYQALAHMAIVSGVGPVSGQPLPLISAGGTSILTTSLALGVMMSVSRYAVRKKKSTKSDVNKEINSLPEEVRAENPSML